MTLISRDAHADKLRALCAEVYQICGSYIGHGMNEYVLDNLVAAASGKDLPHATLIPFEITPEHPRAAPVSPWGSVEEMAAAIAPAISFALDHRMSIEAIKRAATAAARTVAGRVPAPSIRTQRVLDVAVDLLRTYGHDAAADDLAELRSSDEDPAKWLQLQRLLIASAEDLPARPAPTISEAGYEAAIKVYREAVGYSDDDMLTEVSEANARAIVNAAVEASKGRG